MVLECDPLVRGAVWDRLQDTWLPAFKGCVGAVAVHEPNVGS